MDDHDGAAVREELFFENETRKHQQRVHALLSGFARALLANAQAHDASKLQEPERSGFREHTKNLSGLTYGSEEYKQALEALQPTLKAHYQANTHHPEAHKDGVSGMTLLNIVEMFFDWWAATERHDNGDLLRSIDINATRFNLDPQLAQIFKNTHNQMAYLAGSPFKLTL